MNTSKENIPITDKLLISLGFKKGELGSWVWMEDGQNDRVIQLTYDAPTNTYYVESNTDMEEIKVYIKYTNELNMIYTLLHINKNF